MKKIDAIINGVGNEIKAKFKAKKIYRALDNEEDKSQEKLETAKNELDELFIHFGEKDTPKEILESISRKIDIIEEAQDELNRIKVIKDYLNSEVNMDFEVSEKTSKKKK